MKSAGTTVFILACVFAGVGVATWQLRREDAADAALEAVRAQKLRKLEAMDSKAKDLILQGQWREAKEQLLALRAEDKDFEAHWVAELLAAAEREIPLQERLHECLAALERDALGETARCLEQIPNDSAHAASRDRLNREVDAKVNDRLAEVQPLLRLRDDLAKMKEAKAMCEDILVARPDNLRALECKARVDPALDAQRTPNQGDRRIEAWTAARDRYLAGDVDGALLLAEDCGGRDPKCASLAKTFGEFVAAKRKPADLTPAGLDRLSKMDLLLTGGVASPFIKGLARQASRAHAARAMKAFDFADRWTEARKGLALDPTDPMALRVLEEARFKAREAYGLALQYPGEERANALRDLMKVLPDDDAYYLKAKARLAELKK